jgi:hypothetical protein
MDQHRFWSAVSGSRREKLSTKKSKAFSCFEVLDVLFLMAKGFSCSSDVLHGGPGIKNNNFFSSLKFYNFWSPKPWIRIWIFIETIENKPEPLHWPIVYRKILTSVKLNPYQMYRFCSS